MSKVLVLIAAVALSGVVARAADDKPYAPQWPSLARKDEAPEWFRDAKFGIYFHWGVYSVPAFGSEWYPRNMHIKKRREYKHHVETHGEPTKFGYHDFVPRFRAEKFDADEWAELFTRAGARYAGPVAEHHDGFAMWDSEVTPWNAADAGPKRDITGELARAIRKRGMRFVATFHHARNNLWEKEGKWTGHYEFVKKDFPSILEDDRRAILYGYMPRDEFLKLWLAKLKEVIDAYQPDLMWFDSWLHEIPEDVQKEYLAYYFNAARKWGREVVVTRKQDDLPLEVSVEDFEKGRLDRLSERAWLTDDTISRGSWCYTRDLKIKPLRQVLHDFIDIVSKNGCLLLNISPKADGTIPANQREVLLGMGTWLKAHGEAIYGTRPWVVYGEGPTKMARSGHFVGAVRYGPRDVRFTADGDTLYAIFLGKPSGRTTVASLASGCGLAGGEVDRVTLLGKGKVEFARDAEGLHVTFPADAPDENANVLKIEGLKIRGFEPDRSIRFEQGKARLGADRADLHGPGIKTERKDDGKTNVGFWDDPQAWVGWTVRFPEAGEYEVHARLASLQAGRFEVRIANRSLQVAAPATGDWGTFRTVKLGALRVDEAGKHAVEVRPIAPAWKAMNLSFLELRR